MVRGRFVMREGELVESARGWGRSVKAIQNMPTPRPRHVETTSRAIVASGAGWPMTARPAEGAQEQVWDLIDRARHAPHSTE
jgi:dihydroorotase